MHADLLHWFKNFPTLDGLTAHHYGSLVPHHTRFPCAAPTLHRDRRTFCCAPRVCHRTGPDGPPTAPSRDVWTPTRTARYFPYPRYRQHHIHPTLTLHTTFQIRRLLPLPATALVVLLPRDYTPPRGTLDLAPRSHRTVAFTRCPYRRLLRLFTAEFTCPHTRLVTAHVHVPTVYRRTPLPYALRAPRSRAVHATALPVCACHTLCTPVVAHGSPQLDDSSLHPTTTAPLRLVGLFVRALRVLYVVGVVTHWLVNDTPTDDGYTYAVTRYTTLPHHAWLRPLFHVYHRAHPRARR